jgi:hypothetical protein
MDIVYSVNGVPIRMTSERWYHIVETHDYMGGYYHEVLRTVEHPDFVTQGYRGSLIAHRGFGRTGYLVVIYKELKSE